jgi:hypothetical protein
VNKQEMERYQHICGAVRKEGIALNWKGQVITRPRCNRIPNHPGLHAKRSRKTFAVLVEWTDAECTTPKG